MKFKIGDLVKVKPNSPIYDRLKDTNSLAIVMQSARLMYVFDQEHVDTLREFWAYTLLIEGETHCNIPEEGLEIFENEDEEDFE